LKAAQKKCEDELKRMTETNGPLKVQLKEGIDELSREKGSLKPEGQKRTESSCRDMTDISERDEIIERVRQLEAP
jgi:hypothetical protein